MPKRARAIKKLAKVHRAISRLSSELETLQFMQDRLEREIKTDIGKPTGSPSLRPPAKGKAPITARR